MNGIEVCKTLRKGNIATPVLMLTALGSTENVVTGLDSGSRRLSAQAVQTV